MVFDLIIIEKTSMTKNLIIMTTIGFAGYYVFKF